MRLRDRTIIAGVSVIAVVLLALFLSGTVSLSVRLPTATNQVATSKTSASFQISILAGQSDSRWLRGAANDTPEYATAVNWSVCNAGPLIANNTSVLVRSEGAVVGHELFPLPANACHDGKVDLRYSYETATHRVAIEAFSGGSGANKSVAIDVALPRILLEPGTAPSPELFEFAKLFITPNDPVIKQKVKELFQGDQYAFLCPHGPPDPKCPDWMVLDAIEAWVEYYVKSTGLVSVYAGSRLLAGDEIVQVPRETLQSEKGNDFDKALLVVSLARAAGIRSDKIFVVVGTNGTTGTGWVYDKVDRRVPHLTNWHQPPWCQCSDYGYVFHPACCPKSEGCRSDVCGLLYTWAVYYFNDEVAEMAT